MSNGHVTVQIEVAITLLTPLSVGASGSSGAIADKPLMRDGWGRPIIPGSQIKGRIRHACERIARALDCAVCAAPTAETMCPNDPGIQRHATEEPHLYRANQIGVTPRQCVVCAAFGSALYPSPLSFGDAVVLPPSKTLSDAPVRVTSVDSRLRPGVGLDRRRGTALEGVLYTVETTEAGIRLRGMLEGEWHDTPQEEVRGLVGLVIAGLQMTTRWGGASSRGLGWASCNLQVLLDGQPEEPGALVKELGTLCRTAS